MSQPARDKAYLDALGRSSRGTVAYEGVLGAFLLSRIVRRISDGQDTALMGASGLVLWFPVAASHVLPGWMSNVALFVHGAEASLAIGFIFVVHFFNGHLRPGKFPMDLVIFTGSVAADELRHERPAEYERLRRSGTLETLCVAPPDPTAVRRGRIVGTIGLTLGLGLVALILYAVAP